MCGRYSLSTSKEKLQKQLGDIDVGQNLRINFNIAPTQHAYVITNHHPNRLEYFNWGLIPHWSKEGTKNSGKLINARSEGIATKPSFRLPIRKRRCLVLADSFYEWKKEGGQKIPYRILLRNGKLMLMAGIWDEWMDGSHPVRSFSIITTEPNHEMKPIHNRMPVIFKDKRQQQKWLEDQELDNVLGMLKTPKDGILDLYRVSTKVNSVRNNSSDLHLREPEQPTLF